MKKQTLAIITGLAAFAMSISIFASEMATPSEAKVMSEKAMAEVKAMGKEKAFAKFAEANGGFQTKDLYVFCMDMEGVMLSHAKKPQLIGKNLHDYNKYGDFLFQDMIKVSKDGNQGWVDYKWPYPGSDDIREKASYIIGNSEFFCGVGAYK